MTRILFVCLGNICRSVAAEYIFRELLRKRGMEDRFSVDSAGTSDEEEGHGIYPPMRAVLTAHGIPCGNHRARKITKADYENFDLILGMDSANLRNMTRIFGGDPEKKCHLLTEYTDRGGEVADPWYSGEFDSAFTDIFDGCTGLLEQWT